MYIYIYINISMTCTVHPQISLARPIVQGIPNFSSTPNDFLGFSRHLGPRPEATWEGNWRPSAWWIGNSNALIMKHVVLIRKIQNNPDIFWWIVVLIRNIQKYPEISRISLSVLVLLQPSSTQESLHILCRVCKICQTFWGSKFLRNGGPQMMDSPFTKGPCYQSTLGFGVPQCRGTPICLKTTISGRWTSCYLGPCGTNPRDSIDPTVKNGAHFPTSLTWKWNQPGRLLISQRWCQFIVDVEDNEISWSWLVLTMVWIPMASHFIIESPVEWLWVSHGIPYISLPILGDEKAPKWLLTEDDCRNWGAVQPNHDNIYIYTTIEKGIDAYVWLKSPSTSQFLLGP